MYYILISNGSQNFYQEIERGTMQRICDLDGNTISENIGPAWIIDANPPPPIWAREDGPVFTYPVSRILSRLEFRNRFTMEEKVSIYTAAATNVSIAVWLDDLASAENVDLDSPLTQQGVQALVTLGLITEARRDQILDA
jgi:hypothetical protein